VTREEALHKIKAALGERLIAIEEKSAKRAFVELSPDDVPTASHLRALDSLGCVITVRTRLDRNDPCIDSLAPFCPAAEWIEREMWELLGIRFRNHPDMRHLLLSDDWPEGKYPLRRDYQA
jgi:Ni,Fe-hydrogenase III component G